MTPAAGPGTSVVASGTLTEAIVPPVAVLSWLTVADGQPPALWQGSVSSSRPAPALSRAQPRNLVPAVAYAASRGAGVNAGSPVAVCIASRTLTTFAAPASSSI